MKPNHEYLLSSVYLCITRGLAVSVQFLRQMPAFCLVSSGYTKEVLKDGFYPDLRNVTKSQQLSRLVLNCPDSPLRHEACKTK